MSSRQGFTLIEVVMAVLIFSLMMVSRLTLKASGLGSSEQEDENGLSYGVGAKISIFSFEFMRYIDNNEVEADVVSVGVQYTFD